MTEIIEHGEQVVVMDRADRGPLTDEERAMIVNMDSVIDEDDEDCPEIPEAMIKQMKRDIAQKRGVRRVAN